MSTLSFRNVTIDPQSVAVWKGLQGVTLTEEGGGFEPPIVPSAPPASCLWIWMHCLSSCSSTMPTAAVFPPWWMMGPIPLELEAPTRCFLSQVALVTRQNNQHTLIIGLVIWWFNSCIMLESRYLWRFITLLSEKPKLADCSFSLLPTTLSLRQCVVSVCESNKPSHHKGTKKERHFVWSWVKRELYFKASKNLNNCDHSLSPFSAVPVLSCSLSLKGTSLTFLQTHQVCSCLRASAHDLLEYLPSVGHVEPCYQTGIRMVRVNELKSWESQNWDGGSRAIPYLPLPDPHITTVIYEDHGHSAVYHSTWGSSPH